MDRKVGWVGKDGTGNEGTGSDGKGRGGKGRNGKEESKGRTEGTDFGNGMERNEKDGKEGRLEKEGKG
jgi:hypothetical protein